MAISLKDLIDLELLTYYDEQIKKYIAAKLVTISGSAQFVSAKDLDNMQGQEDVLYVTEKGIKIWDPEAEEFKDLPGGSGEDQYWDKF